MSSEEKINELTKRIEVLEQAEKKRQTKKKIRIIYEVTKIVILVTILLGAYLYLNAKVIRPYRETVDKVNEKVNSVENFVDEKLDNFKNLFKKD